MANSKLKYIATVGITIDAHGTYPALRIEQGQDANKVCPCHLAQLLEDGDIVKAENTKKEADDA